jgi:serine/threonine-protein kinase
MRNVLELPIRPPSELVPGYPPELESLVLDALSRDPDRRPPTAARFAERLERYLYSLPEPSTAARVGAWMREHFGERKLERDVFLRQQNAEHHVDAPHETSDPSAGSLAARRLTVDPPQRRRRWALPVAVAIVALAGAGLWVARDALLGPPAAEEHARAAPTGTPSDPVDPVEATNAPNDPTETTPEATSAPSDPEPVPPIAPPIAPTTAEPAVSTAPAPVEDDADAEGSTAAVGAEPAAASAAEAPRSKRAREPTRSGTLSLLAIPPAFVHWRGQRLGRTPLMEHELPAGTHTLELHPVSGGEPERVTVRIRPGANTSRSVSF